MEHPLSTPKPITSLASKDHDRDGRDHRQDQSPCSPQLEPVAFIPEAYISILSHDDASKWNEQQHQMCGILVGTRSTCARIVSLYYSLV